MKTFKIVTAAMCLTALNVQLVLAAPPEGKGKPNKAAKATHSESQSNNANGMNHGPRNHDEDYGYGDNNNSQHSDKNGINFDISVIFGKREREHIHDYYRKDAKKCPPGLAKKHNGCLPPGIAKKRYQVGHHLPNDISIRDLPDIILGRLPHLPDGYGYRELDGDIALIDLTTNVILDAVARN